MPVTRTEVDTDIINEVLGRFYTVPVYYTDELVETSIYDFAFSSVIGAYLPYLFLGFFTDRREFNKWFFQTLDSTKKCVRQ